MSALQKITEKHGGLPEIRDILLRWKIGKSSESVLNEPKKPIRVLDKDDLRKANIPFSFQDCTREKINQLGVPPAFKKEYAQVSEYLNHLDKNIQNGKGLLLQGTVGTTKSTLAVAILQEALAGGFSGYFLSMIGILKFFKSREAQNKEEYWRLNKKLASCSLLVIDDFGAEHLSPWDMDHVDFIINERYNNQKATIFTTNLFSESKRNKESREIILMGLDDKYGA